MHTHHIHTSHTHTSHNTHTHHTPNTTFLPTHTHLSNSVGWWLRFKNKKLTRGSVLPPCAPLPERQEQAGQRSSSFCAATPDAMGCSHSTRVHHSNGRPSAAPSALRAWLPSRDLLTERPREEDLDLESTESKVTQQEQQHQRRPGPGETLADVCAADSETDGSPPLRPLPPPLPSSGLVAPAGTEPRPSAGADGRSSAGADDDDANLRSDAATRDVAQPTSAEDLCGVPDRGCPLPVGRSRSLSDDPPLPGFVAGDGTPRAGLAQSGGNAESSEADPPADALLREESLAGATAAASSSMCVGDGAARGDAADGVEAREGHVPETVTPGLPVDTAPEESREEAETATGVCPDSSSEGN
ncbi:uncharacterized protein LOC144718018 [Lampetra planeri]